MTFVQAALEALLDLVKAANKYTKKREADAADAGWAQKFKCFALRLKNG